MHRLFFALLIVFSSSLVLAQGVNIGVLAYNGKPQAIARWQPTADYLTQNIPQYQFNIHPLTHEEFNHSINKKSIDFILTNPGHFVLLEVEKDITSIATLVSRYENQTLNQFSAVLMARNDGSVNELSDLKGKTLAAVNEQAFGGFQLAQNELLNHGIDVKADLDILWLGFPHVDLVMSVLEGKADVATVRSGVLEKMIAQRKIKRSDFKILASKENKEFPFDRSFGMFPEWPFAKLPHTDLELSKKVVTTLLQMPSDDSAALIANGAGWTIPFNYASVHTILKRLKVAPYLPRSLTMSELWQAYKLWVVIVVILFLMCLLLLWHFFKFNRQLKISQQDLKHSQAYLEQSVVDRTHDLNQINSSLKAEIERHIETETELNKGCEALQNIYLIFVRGDLSRTQRLNSVVEALQYYLGFELVMLSKIVDQQFELCCIRPSSEDHASPLSSVLAQKTIKHKQTFHSEDDEQWQEYLACPIFLNGHLNYLLELASSHAFKQSDHPNQTSKLGHNILYLIAHWVGYEALSIANELEESDKHSNLIERFDGVTPREKEIIRLLMKGESNKSMARLLNLSVKTIEMHRANALRKTESKSSTEIVQMATQSGLFDTP